MKKLLISFTLLFLSLYSVARENIDDLVQTLSTVSQHWKVMGVGSPMQELNINDNFIKFLAFPNGSCAQEAYYFAKEAKERKFDAKRVSLWSSSGVNDVMVEVRSREGDYLFVPSSGVYYEYSLWDLLKTPLLANQYVGVPIADTEIFINPGFFSSITRIDRYTNDNQLEANLLQRASSIESFGLMNGYGGEAGFDNNKGNYIAGVQGVDTQGFKAGYKIPIDMYRVNIDWYSHKDVAKTVFVKIKLKSRTIELDSRRDTESFYWSGQQLDIYTGKLNGVEELTFTFGDFQGQKRTLINEIGVY